MIKILIAEDIPSHNKGEEALFLGLHKSLQNLAPCEFKLLSLNPQHDAKNYSGMAEVVDARGITPAHMIDSQASVAAKVFNIFLFFMRYALFGIMYKIMGTRAMNIMPNPVWQAFCEADLVLMAHDSFFAPRYHSCIALFCSALKKPVAIYAGTTENKLFHQEAGKKVLARKMLRYAMSKVPLILVRENFSYENLLELGLDPKKQKIEVHADLAFIVDPSSPERADEILLNEAIPRDKPLIGMTVSLRQTQHAYYELPLAERTEKSIAALTELVDHITKTTGANLVFIPHSIGPSRFLDDRATADMIIEKAADPEKIFNIRTEYSVRDLKAVAGRLDLALGTRLHFIVDALCHSVPSLLLTHKGEARCHGIVGSMVGLEKWLYNTDKISATELITLFDELWRDKDEVHSYLAEKMPQIKEDVYKHGILAKELLEKYRTKK